MHADMFATGSTCRSKNRHWTARENHTVGGRPTGAGFRRGGEMKLVIQETTFLAAKLNLFTEPAAGFRHLD